MATLPRASGDESGRPQPEALRRILAQRPCLLAFILSLVRDFVLAEQVFEDLCVAACARETASPEDAAFGAWAREQARRRALALLGARARDGAAAPSAALVDELERAVAELSATPAARLARRKEALRASLQALPAHLRQVLERRYAGNLVGAALAEKLGRERADVVETLLRARQELCASLRRRLAAEGGTP